jgi:hypothetical protein
MGRAGGAGATERAGAQAGVVADILGLTRDAISDLRKDGLSLAQIAAKQKVDPQKLVDALTAQWTARIEARVQNGALTADQAATLRTQLATRAKDMVFEACTCGTYPVPVTRRNAVSMPPNGQSASGVATPRPAAARSSATTATTAATASWTTRRRTWCFSRDRGRRLTTD